jgi:hypothetical protein
VDDDTIEAPQSSSFMDCNKHAMTLRSKAKAAAPKICTPGDLCKSILNLPNELGANIYEFVASGGFPSRFSQKHTRALLLALPPIPTMQYEVHTMLRTIYTHTGDAQA